MNTPFEVMLENAQHRLETLRREAENDALAKTFIHNTRSVTRRGLRLTLTLEWSQSARGF